MKSSLLEHLEVEYTHSSTNDYVTHCLWCGAESKLSISKEEGNVFQCWKCHEKGNGLSFMRKWFNLLPEITVAQAREFVIRKKGVVPSTLKSEGIRYDNRNFWFPVRNSKGDIIALHKFDTTSGIIYASPKPFNCSILGMQHNTGKTEELWIAEGHADYLILRGLMAKMKEPQDSIGTCGAGFSGSYLHLLSDRNIILLFDNDDAGRTGIRSVARRIKTSGINVKSIKYIDWTTIPVPGMTEIPSGFDLRDLHNAYNGAVT